jgi:hypothetical protein
VFLCKPKKKNNVSVNEVATNLLLAELVALMAETWSSYSLDAEILCFLEDKQGEVL